MVYTTNSSNLLPPEILSLIFDKLSKKEDHKTCLLVCKSWKFIAQKYFSEDISIMVNGFNLNKLLTDIPLFGHSVKYIKKGRRISTINFSKEDWTVKWWDIITMCPNLTSIYLDYDTSEIIAKLGSSEKKLKSIQKIQVDDIVNFPLDFHGLYVRANIRYYETITSLVISDWEQNPVVLEYGGLIELVSKFPQLTYLKVTHRKIQGTEMNLSQLLKASPKLQELEIYDIAKITSTDTAEGLEKFYLTKITLQADEISIKSLNYIITDLPDQVDNFCLLISKVKPDKSISEEESKEIINKLETLTTGIPRVDIQFEYKGKIFSIVTSEDSYICGSNIDDDALIGFYDCVDDPFLYDDEY